MRLAESESVGYGFDLPNIVVAPNAPKKIVEIGGRGCSVNCQKERGKVLVDVTGIEPVTPACKASDSTPSAPSITANY